MSFTQDQIEEEQVHFANVISTFQQYAPYAVSDLAPGLPRLSNDKPID